MSSFFSSVGSIFSEATSGAESIFTEVTSGAGSAFTQLTSGAGSVFSEATSVGGSLASRVTSDVGSVVSVGESIATGVFETVTCKIFIPVFYLLGANLLGKLAIGGEAFTIVTSAGGAAITLAGSAGNDIAGDFTSLTSFAGATYTALIASNSSGSSGA